MNNDIAEHIQDFVCKLFWKINCTKNLKKNVKLQQKNFTSVRVFVTFVCFDAVFQFSNFSFAHRQINICNIKYI